MIQMIIFQTMKKKEYIYIMMKIKTKNYIVSIKYQQINNSLNYDVQIGEIAEEEQDIILKKKEISIIKESTLVEYEMHNYIKEQIIIEKIKQNKVSNEEMKNPLFQKFYFLETFLNYPHLTYN